MNRWMKKVAIVGGGIGGLTIGAFLAKDGYEVEVFDKNEKVGGVCALAEKNGYQWEQGPLILGSLLPGQSTYCILQELGIKIPVVRQDRGIEMSDYAMWRPQEYEGPYWRRERLKQLFPEEKRGINRYYRFYDDMLKVRYLQNLCQTVPTRFNRMKRMLAMLKVKRYANMTAQQVVEYFFSTPKIQALFTGILCDVCISPMEVSGLAVPFNNYEGAFDLRIPTDRNDLKNGENFSPGFVNIVGGVQKLPEALADYITKHNGTIYLNTVVDKVIVEDATAKGIVTADGRIVDADLVIGSGGGREFFEKTVGLEHLDETYREILSTFRPMESVFMVHLGLDYDPLQFMQSPLCYYYKTYDIPAAIERIRKGIYHKGEDGYLIYVDSAHAPDFAPKDRFCLTIYTVAPDQPVNVDWKADKDVLADYLIQLVQEQLPELSEHITERLVLTPADYRKMTHLDKSAFGGVIPVEGIKNPPHKTPVKNLWFVGQQSESTGGISSVMRGSKKTYENIKKELLM